ncbi:MAG: arginine--tRNA ligase, partial [Candidatus Gastranaerophilales bacterium]|nr:arginine--tRNA ligase [Candidatus Gastranaerophilales bacterium]
VSMLRDYFLNKIENAIEKAIEAGKLGQMNEYNRGALPVEKPKNPEFGDFAVNVSSLARNAKIAPPQIASAIVEFIEKDDCEYSVIGGFINFKAGDSLLINLIEEIYIKRNEFGRPNEIEKENIILEYISANPTGPFHIGHGRWAAMGSALANLLKFYGHDVYQEFYINDAGSQIQKLGRSLVIRVKQELGSDIDFPEDEIERKNYYPGDYLIPVAKAFLSEHSELKSVDDVDKIELQVYCDFAKAYEEKVQRDLLDNFRVSFDKFYSELTLHNSGKVDECVQKLKNSGKIYQKEGADWFKSSDYGDDQDRVIKKADGSNTYLTADIAYHVDKLERGFDRMINIWGADHHGYVARVKASIEALGYNPEKLEVLLGQLVNLVINGNEVRMGKRKNMVTLEDLIDEVGVDATRFWMSMRNIDTTLDFDIELAKTKSDENPVFYVQYAHARACSIIRNATNDKLDTESGKNTPAIISEADFEKLITEFDSNIASISVKDARKLILKLEEFKSLIKSSAQARQVYTICRYVQELASEFHSFYNSTRVITDELDVTKSRLILVWAFKTVLA